jgi:hypothetical protein
MRALVVAREPRGVEGQLLANRVGSGIDPHSRYQRVKG